MCTSPWASVSRATLPCTGAKTALMRSVVEALRVLSLASREASEKRSTVSSSPWACSPLTLGATSRGDSEDGSPLPGRASGAAMAPEDGCGEAVVAEPAEWTWVKTGPAGVGWPAAVLAAGADRAADAGVSIGVAAPVGSSEVGSESGAPVAAGVTTVGWLVAGALVGDAMEAAASGSSAETTWGHCTAPAPRAIAVSALRSRPPVPRGDGAPWSRACEA